MITQVRQSLNGQFLNGKQQKPKRIKGSNQYRVLIDSEAPAICYSNHNGYIPPKRGAI